MSTGRPVEQVESETSINWEVGLRYRNSRVQGECRRFINTIDGNIQKQALILPQGAVGTSLGGQPITSQNANGAVFVSLSTLPVLVRANFDHARVWGLEFEGDVHDQSSDRGRRTFTYLEARGTDTNLPPNIEGGTPAPGGTVWVRFAPANGRWWVQPYSLFAGNQSTACRRSTRATVAPAPAAPARRFRTSSGAARRVRGFVSAGADGVFGNADDTLIETGETLAQIQDRVLGVGVNSSPLWTEVPSYALFGIRFGMRFGPHSIVIDAENLTDESYRGISWGMDGAGRGISVRYSVSFN